MSNINLTEPKAITPLRYVGGKSKMVKRFLSPLFPEFSGDFYDPFLGGGSVPLWISQMYPDKTIYVNDLNKAVTDFWLVLRDLVDEMVTELLEIRGNYDPIIVSEGVALLQDRQKRLYESDDLFERAVSFYVLNKISFSGMTEHGSISKSAYEKTFNPTNIQKLVGISEKLDNFVISNIDYVEHIKDIKKDDFLFLDPPYDLGKKSTLYGKNGEMHIGFDHDRFAEEIIKLPCKWMITYNDSEEIRDRFKFFTIRNQEYLYSMAFQTDEEGNKSARKKNELIITNY